MLPSPSTRERRVCCSSIMGQFVSGKHSLGNICDLSSFIGPLHSVLGIGVTKVTRLQPIESRDFW